MAKLTTKVDARQADTSFIPISPATETTLLKVPGLSVPIHDYIALTYTGANLTGVVYKTGGAAGTTVATLTLAYTGAVLDSVTKT
jgi:hypothetical protein